MLEPGASLPDIAMLDDRAEPISPRDYRRRKWVLYFYPRANTPGCTSEAQEFSLLKPAFDAENCAILGVSCDSVQKLQNFIRKYDLKIRLASDQNADFCKAMGVWGEKKLYGKIHMGIRRSTFIIDERGAIIAYWPKLRVKGHAAEVLSRLRQLSSNEGESPAMEKAQRTNPADVAG